MSTKRMEGRKKGEKKIEIPEGIEIEVNEGINEVVVRGGGRELKKKFKPEVKVRRKNNYLVISSVSDRRKIKALVGTAFAEVKNMIQGLKGGVVYKLKVVHSHFPVNLKIQGDKLWIENFLGEKYPRNAKILEGVKVEIKGQEIEVRSTNKESAGQTAANIEQATHIKNRDKRVFQDGCYIYEKDGKSLLR